MSEFENEYRTPAELVEAIRARSDKITDDYLMKVAPECFTEQLHTISNESDTEPGPERIYWHYGRVIAFRDVYRWFKDMGFVS